HSTARSHLYTLSLHDALPISSDRDGRALLRRACGDDAEGGRAVRLSARGVLAALGLSLRLDTLPRHTDRNNRRRRRRLRQILRRDRKSTRLNSSHRTISYAVF